MIYFAAYDENGRLVSVGYTSAQTTTGAEITREEYEALSAEINVKTEYAEKVYHGEIAIGDVPEEWRADVQEMVDERIAAEGEYDPDEISDDEALAIIQGVVG